MELEEGYRCDAGSRSGTETAYSVEARYNYHAPIALGSQIFDSRWRKVSFDKSPIGVPTGGLMNRHAQEFGLLSYAAAQALRWWLHAAADAECAFCLESRLIKHSICYSQKATAVSVHDIVGGEDRSSMMPDYKAQATSHGAAMDVSA